ncbi:MAG: aldo/keto reductase [Planctomycetes bacterium]|nr:aldo/keto reductase [Planctomycetota bacterium]
MHVRQLGRTNLSVSVVSFGAGPVSGLMTGTDCNRQLATVAAAIKAGINWFDTAPGYGQGSSETNLGRVLAELRASESVQIATKVRIPDDPQEPVADFVRRSVEESLARLRVARVSLLQLHNGLTARRGDAPSSITPADVLGPNGVLSAFRQLQKSGVVGFLGLTGTGQPEALRTVIHSGEFDTVQAPYNLLNPSAGTSAISPSGSTHYGNIFADCLKQRMGVFAIRVFAGGALLGQPPSTHTLKTPYFPLALHQSDLQRAERIRVLLGNQLPMSELAVRFALAHPLVTSAILGLGDPDQVNEIVNSPLDAPLAMSILKFL